MPYRKLLWDAYQALELEPGMKVLDAGCGSGNFELFVSEKDPPAVEIEAHDYSPAMLARARKKCAGRLDCVNYPRGDFNGQLPYADATFDRIVSVNVLYALEKQDNAMSELLRVLKPGGRIVLTSPAPGYGWGPLVVDHFQREATLRETRSGTGAA